MTEDVRNIRIRYFMRGEQGEKILPLRYWFDDIEDDEEVEYVEVEEFDDELVKQSIRRPWHSKEKDNGGRS
ncbi:hypothetical protein IJT93_01220 [bacterium]|nr:hypothetical protein [bacterium]